MKILVDLQSCQTGSSFRGIGRYSLSLLKAMLERPRGHDFAVVLNGTFWPTVERLRGELQGLIDNDRIMAWRQPPHTAPYKIEDSWRRAASELMRESFLARWAPDILHISSLFEGVADEAVITIDRFFDGPPVAITHYDLIPHFYRDKYLPSESMQREFDRRFEALKRASCFLSISSYSGEELIEVTGVDRSKVVNIGAGVGSEFSRHMLDVQGKERTLSALGLRENFILYAGGGDSRKNIEGLLKAYARLPDALHFANQLVLVSKMPEDEENRLKAVARKLGIEAHTRFIDYIPDAELVQLYNLCSVTVLPSFHEGFGLPLLEAMACGSPAIGSNRTSIPEVLGREHAMFDPDNLDDFSGKLRQVLEDRSFADRLRREGIEQAAKFTWERSADLAIDAFEETYERQRASYRAMSAGGIPETVAIVANAPDRSLLSQLSSRFDRVIVITNGGDKEEFPENVESVSVDVFKSLALNSVHHRLYCIESSHESRWIIDLAAQFPGHVFMGDGFLGAAFLENGEAGSAAFLRELYISHGYRPLILHAHGMSNADLAAEYPCNLSVLESAQSIWFASSEEASKMLSCYGKTTERSLNVGTLDGALLEEEVFEATLRNTPHTADRVTIAQKLLELEAPAASSEKDYREIAECVATNIPLHFRQKRLFIDISELVLRDAKSGIQRVVRSVLNELVRREIPGYRVEPVYRKEGEKFRHCRAFMSSMLNVNGLGDAHDDLIDVQKGDIFLRIDLVLNGGDLELQFLRDRGVKVYEVLYDLLPVKWPTYFIREMPFLFTRWLNEMAHYADGVICISRTVADEFLAWMDGWQACRSRPLKVGFFHLGSDIEKSLPTHGTTPEAQAVLDDNQGPFFLMVGTVEARKGYGQVLDAFEKLWADGCTARLVIVGKPGWLVEELVARLRDHEELGKRLAWLSNLSDEALLKLYARSDALIMASEAEGYGLPLVEAARHGVPLIVRDLPVFREVAGENAFFFKGYAGEDLAEAITEWMRLQERDAQPRPEGIEILDWEHSVDQLLDVVLGGNWYAEWNPGRQILFTPVQDILSTDVGKLQRCTIETGQLGGLLVESKPVLVPAGVYEIRLNMEPGENMPDRMIWYEFAEAQTGRVISQHWPLNEQRDETGLFVDSVAFEHDIPGIQFRLWVAAGSDIVFHSVGLVPVPARNEAQNDDALVRAPA